MKLPLISHHFPNIFGRGSLGAMSVDRNQLPGLNELRALAALFVVIGHIPLNQAAAGLPSPHWGAFFYRGQPAVLFFFTLSGFLITYLLLRERQNTGKISLSNFYIRRALRIWPLYFAVVAIGLIAYKVVLPELGISHSNDYSTGLAVLLYVFFLPNLMNAMYYPVGGLLNILWSIGIEEQFYICWAPIVRRWTMYLANVCGFIFVLFFLLHILNEHNFFGEARTKLFVGQLKFHFMAAGGLCAWYLHQLGPKITNAWFFRSRFAQVIAFGLLAEFYLLGLIPWGSVGTELLQIVLYSWLVLNTAVNPRSILTFRSHVFNSLGVISYGIYMLHMPAIYLTSAIFMRTSLWHGHTVIYFVAYYILVIGLTILFASLSYQYLERPFLRLKDARFSLQTGEVSSYTLKDTWTLFRRLIRN